LNPEENAPSSSGSSTTLFSNSRSATPHVRNLSLLRNVSSHATSPAPSSGATLSRRTQSDRNTQGHKADDANPWRNTDSVGDLGLDSFDGNGSSQPESTESEFDKESNWDSTRVDENDKDEDKDAAEKSEDEDESDRELTEAQRYMKEKEERIAARKAMEESLAKEWGDLAKAFKKPSPKKRKPRKPKESDALPIRRSARSSQTNTTALAVTPPDAPSTALAVPPPDAPSTSQVPTTDLPNASDIDRKNWPEWLCQAIDELADSTDLVWTALLQKFLMLEERLGYPAGMVSLDTLLLNLELILVARSLLDVGSRQHTDPNK
jgi:hypothetical protein